MTLKDVALIATPAVLANSSSEPPPGFSEWIRVALFLMGGLFLLLGLVEKMITLFRRKPPIDQDMRKIWDELKAMQAQLGKIDEKRTNAIAEVHRVMDRELGDMHQKTNATAIELARVAERTESHSQTLSVVDQKLSTILQRLPRGRAH